MKLNLKNIGPINESSVIIDGLTIITGLNSTGKTTIGKSIYSLVSAIENIQENALNDKSNYAIQVILDVINELELYRYSQFEKLENEYISQAVNIFYLGKNVQFMNLNELVMFVKQFTREISVLDLKQLGKEEFKNLRNYRIIENFEVIKQLQISKLNELISLLETDDTLTRYCNYKIQKILDTEFNNQVCKIGSEDSKIELLDEDKICFDVGIKKNKINLNHENYRYSPLKNTFFIDNVYILDSLDANEIYDEKIIGRRNFRHLNMKEYLFFDSIKEINHNNKLLKTLNAKNKYIYDEILVEKNIMTIMKKINEVMPEKIFVSKNKFVYSNKELDIKNLATGMKIYGIVKLLLEKGKISDDTLLIFDEPESHLHPHWQNLFAEMVIIMIKELDCKIVLTTHSPSFLLALDTYSKKYNLKEKVNYYKSVKEEENYLIKNINEKLFEAYAELSKPFLEIEAEYNKLND